jgi:hypothetical protein
VEVFDVGGKSLSVKRFVGPWAIYDTIEDYKRIEPLFVPTY